MNKIFTGMIGNYTIAIVANDEQHVKLLLKEMIDDMKIEEVERHKGHKILIHKDSKDTVHTYCDDCSHYFFDIDGRRHKKDGFIRPIGLFYDDD